MSQHPPLEVVVWGPLACFTRPEAKVERVSYPVMTPSAARGVLEAILWKPQFDWRVREIHLLCPWVWRRGRDGSEQVPRAELEADPLRWFSILRNEINSRQSNRGAAGDPSKAGHYLADEDRAQRHTLALRDVRYKIVAEIELRDGPAARLDAEREVPTPAKYAEQFQRRVSSGRYFQQPYLGCREFAAHFGPPSEHDAEPLAVDAELGPMLFDLRFRHDAHGRGLGAEPVFFDAKLERGVLHIPPELYARTAPEVSHAAK